jgi:hypothetical protein
VIPKVRGYQIRQSIIVLDSGAKTHKLVRVPIAELSAWDATHDASGRALGDGDSSEQSVQVEQTITDKV